MDWCLWRVGGRHSAVEHWLAVYIWATNSEPALRQSLSALTGPQTERKAGFGWLSVLAQS